MTLKELAEKFKEYVPLNRFIPIESIVLPYIQPGKTMEVLVVGGGGGDDSESSGASAAGGSGVVIVRYKTSDVKPSGSNFIPFFI